MKHLLLLAAGLALATAVHAADAPSNAAAPILAPGINAPAYRPDIPFLARWPAELHGAWTGRAEAEKGVLGGELTLDPKHKLVLQPVGMYKLEGYWYALDDGRLVFDTPLAKTEMRYSFTEKGVLELRYANGLTQKFDKAGRSPSPRKSNKKAKP